MFELRGVLIGLGTILFVNLTYAVQPRFPNPKSPDEVWQNDRDLSDQIKDSFNPIVSSSGTISVINSSTANINRGLFGDGTIAAPSISFIFDQDTGLTRETSNTIGIITGGTPALEMDTTDVSISTRRLNITDGTGPAPGLRFQNDPNTGVLRPANDTMTFATAGSTVITLSPAGEITQPLQPSFLVTYAGSLNETGDGTSFLIPFATEIFDQGSDFATSTFTAPVSGRYLLMASIRVTGITGMTTSDFELRTSNRSLFQSINLTGITGSQMYSVQHVFDMDANDVATVVITINGGAKVADIGGSDYSAFSGSLIN